MGKKRTEKVAPTISEKAPDAEAQSPKVQSEGTSAAEIQPTTVVSEMVETAKQKLARIKKEMADLKNLAKEAKEQAKAEKVASGGGEEHKDVYSRLHSVADAVRGKAMAKETFTKDWLVTNANTLYVTNNPGRGAKADNLKESKGDVNRSLTILLALGFIVKNEDGSFTVTCEPK